MALVIPLLLLGSPATCEIRNGEGDVTRLIFRVNGLYEGINIQEEADSANGKVRKLTVMELHRQM